MARNRLDGVGTEAPHTRLERIGDGARLVSGFAAGVDRQHAHAAAQ